MFDNVCTVYLVNIISWKPKWCIVCDEQKFSLHIKYQTRSQVVASSLDILKADNKTNDRYNQNGTELLRITTYVEYVPEFI